jgi:hypothetical protein
MARLLQFPVGGRLALLKLEQQQRKIQAVLAMSHRPTRIGFILMGYSRTNGGTQLGSSRQELLGAVMGWELGGSFFLFCRAASKFRLRRRQMSHFRSVRPRCYCLLQAYMTDEARPGMFRKPTALSRS